MSSLDPPSLAINSQLGKFILLDLLGEGGMGRVYLARDTSLERRVALKVMLPSVVDRSEYRSRFLREARLAASLEHERIVRVYEVGEDRGVPFMAMELLKGETLLKYLERQPIPPLPVTLKLIAQVLQGLQAAHEHGLVHRDIKPANIWIEWVDGELKFRCKILDFGVARALAPDGFKTQPGMVVGTLHYMSYEQLEAKNVDGRSDLFSLGVIFYQMLTGRLPYSAESLTERVVQLIDGRVRPPSRINPRVPEPISELVMHLLEHRPADRPRDAEECLRLLREAIEEASRLRANSANAPTATREEIAEGEHDSGPPPLPRREIDFSTDGSINYRDSGVSRFEPPRPGADRSWDLTPPSLDQPPPLSAAKRPTSRESSTRPVPPLRSRTDFVPEPRRVRWWLWSGGTLLLVLLIGGLIWMLRPSGNPVGTPEPGGPRLIDGSKARALLIGVASHADSSIPSRPTAGQDAEAWAEFLADPRYLGIPSNRVTQLVSNGSTPPTRSNILAALRTLAKEATEDDTVYIILIGQGATVLDRSALICSDSQVARFDSTTLTATDVEGEMSSLRAGRLFVLADLTFPDSANLREETSSALGRAFMQPNELDDAAPGRLLIASNGVTTSKALRVNGHSFFSEECMKALRDLADTEGGEADGVVTGGELYDYLNSKLTASARAAGASSEDSLPYLDLMTGPRWSFPLSRNPNRAPVAERTLGDWKALCVRERVTAESEAEGVRLLSRIPTESEDREVRKQFQLAVAEKWNADQVERMMTRERESRALPRAEAERFAADVMFAIDKIGQEHVNEPNRGTLAAAAARGLFRWREVPLPPEFETTLASPSSWTTDKMTRVLVDARIRLGKRASMEAPRDSEAAIAWMLPALRDRYTTYTDKKVTSAEDAVGNFTGIGVTIRRNQLQDTIDVISPIKGGPAFKAGVRSGDRIIEVRRDVDPQGNPLKPGDQRVISTRGMTVNDLIPYLLGKTDTPVSIVVQREGEAKPITYELRRNRIMVETVLGVTRVDDGWDYLLDANSGIAYIRVTQFNYNTVADLRLAVEQIRRDGRKGLILDLRGNTGGDLNAAIDMADMFLGEKVIMTSRPRVGDAKKYTSKLENSFTDFPMAVLVNRQSASASEIVSSALQDNGRAVIVGERTFGKGCIQTVYTQERTGGRLLVTTSRFFPPSERNIDRQTTSGRPDEDWGVKPSNGFEVTLSSRERADVNQRLNRHPEFPRPGEQPRTIRDGQDRVLDKARDYLREQIRLSK